MLKRGNTIVDLHGQKVYEYQGKYYFRDVDSHNGGVWKVFVEVNGKLKRVGTADENFNIFKKKKHYDPSKY